MKRTIFSAVGLILVGLLLTSAFTLTAGTNDTHTGKPRWRRHRSAGRQCGGCERDGQA